MPIGRRWSRKSQSQSCSEELSLLSLFELMERAQQSKMAVSRLEGTYLDGSSLPLFAKMIELKGAIKL